MIGLIIAAVLLVVFGVLAFLASKTWKASHLVLLFFVFLMSLAFTAFSTAALKTRGAWKKKHDDLAQQIERKKEQLEQLSFGGDKDSPSVPQMEIELRKITIDRGRVWRGAVPADLVDGVVTLNLAKWGGDSCFALGEEDQPAAPAEGEGAAPAGKPHGIDEGMVLYAFLESSVTGAPDAIKQALFGDSELPNQDEQGRCRIPFKFLGSFRVAGVEGPNIQVKSVIAATNPEEAGQGSWVLYEIMPVDQHESLAGMAPEQLAAIFPESPDKNQIIQEYAKDMQDAPAGEDPQRTMQRVKFLREYTVDVDVDEEEKGIEDFDPTGRAVAADLRQGEPTTFKEGDTPDVPFDSQTAAKLRADGIVEFVEEAPIYVRRLRDYARGFSLDATELQKLNNEYELLKIDNDAIAATAEKARAQIAYREQELKRLGIDQEKLDAELATLSSFRQKLEQEFELKRSEMSSLYHWNHQLADSLRGFIFAGN